MAGSPAQGRTMDPAVRFDLYTNGSDCVLVGSKNGSRVNPFHVQEQLLRNGDRIDLGTIRLYVEIGPAAVAPRAGGAALHTTFARDTSARVLRPSSYSSACMPLRSS